MFLALRNTCCDIGRPHLKLDDSLRCPALMISLPSAILANEVKLGLLDLLHTNAHTLTMLPYTATFTSNAVSAVVCLTIETACTIEEPIVLHLLIDVFQRLPFSFNFCLDLQLRRTRCFRCTPAASRQSRQVFYALSSYFPFFLTPMARKYAKLTLLLEFYLRKIFAHFSLFSLMLLSVLFPLPFLLFLLFCPVCYSTRSLCVGEL